MGAPEAAHVEPRLVPSAARAPRWKADPGGHPWDSDAGAVRRQKSGPWCPNGRDPWSPSGEGPAKRHIPGAPMGAPKQPSRRLIRVPSAARLPLLKTDPAGPPGTPTPGM